MVFNLGETVSVEGNDYTVEGIIVFSNIGERSKWTEYKIRHKYTNKIAWLSIDTSYREYAIYFQKAYNSNFERQNIINRGYHEVDSGKAKVVQASGNVDVDYGDSVSYKEYEDASEENIVAVEVWDDEIEYSTGYYLDAHEIVGRGSASSTGNFSSYGGYKRSNSAGNLVKKIITIVVLFIVGVTMYSAFGGSSKKKISKYLAKSSYYKYETSLTADLNNKQKADVYSSYLSIGTVAKDIIKQLEGDVTEVQQNSEDSSIGILTKYEYCFIYKGEDDESTLIQISPRAYAYSSNHRPYRSRSSTARYYRNYYYSTAYSSDKSSFSKSSNAYSNYDGELITLDSSNPYKTYSNTVRQESINRRNSSGGGTSFGK